MRQRRALVFRSILFRTGLDLDPILPYTWRARSFTTSSTYTCFAVSDIHGANLTKALLYGATRIVAYADLSQQTLTNDETNSASDTDLRPAAVLHVLLSLVRTTNASRTVADKDSAWI